MKEGNDFDSAEELSEKEELLENDGTEPTFAEQEFVNYCEANEIDHDEAAMDADERKDFLRIKRHFTTAVEEKRLIVDGDKLIYTISDRSPKNLAGTKLTISRPNGRAMLAMDGYKDTQQVNKLQAFMAAISGTKKYDIGNIAGLDNKDYQFIQDIAVLLLTAEPPPGLMEAGGPKSWD
jgi:hypothetical protein